MSNNNKSEHIENVVNIVIFLIVIAIVVGLLMWTPVKNWIINNVRFWGDKLGIAIYEHPYISMGILILLVLGMGLLSAILSKEVSKEEIEEK